MIKFKFTLLLLLAAICCQGQSKSSLDSCFIKNLSNQIKKKILERHKSGSTYIDENCYGQYESGEKMPLSCFEVTGNCKWTGDINQDGEDDVVLKVIDEGLGEGGNGYGYDFFIVYLKNRKISKVDTVFGGGEFSYASLDIDSISNGSIFTTLSENMKGKEDEANKIHPKIRLQFIWDKGKLVEKKYLTSKFCKMDKRIFKPEISTVKRALTTYNDQYEEEEQETLKLNNEKIKAKFSGCNTMELNFYIDRPYDNKLKTNSIYKKMQLLGELSRLKGLTRFSELMESASRDINKSGVVEQKKILLPNGWSYYLGISSYKEDNNSRLTIIFTNSRSKKIHDFWGLIKR